MTNLLHEQLARLLHDLSERGREARPEDPNLSQLFDELAKAVAVEPADLNRLVGAKEPLGTVGKCFDVAMHSPY